MKAIMLDVPPHLLEQRRRIGADRWDEVWEGVLHMPPSPDLEHQDVARHLANWLERWWCPQSGGKVWTQVNVARPGAAKWTDDYRVPDVVALLPERFPLQRKTHLLGGPDLVVEIRSPGDETDEKIPFYAAIGVRETWIVDRDTRALQVLDLSPRPPAHRPARRGGWITSCLGIELRTTTAARLELRLAGDRASTTRIPR